MHQNRFWLGLCPRLRWISDAPDPLAGFPTSKGREKGDREDIRGGEKKEGAGN